MIIQPPYSTETLEPKSAFEQDVISFIEEWNNELDYIIARTSGSTGKPKKIALKKAYVKNSALKTLAYFQLSAGDAALLCLSPHYIAGKLMIVRAIIGKLVLTCIEPQARPLEAHDGAFDFAAMIPHQAISSLSEINRIDKLIIGGGVLPRTQEKELIKHANRVYTTYGMTETVTHVAIRDLSAAPLFKALPGVSFSTDSRDCLIIKAPSLGVESLTTNDIVALENEKVFAFKGRYDNVINTGGIKVFPEEIESYLAPNIEHDFFIFGAQHQTLGESVSLVIESSEENYVNTDFDQLFNGLSPSYSKPRSILFINSFQRTPSGKIKRKATFDQAQKKPE